MIKDQHLKKLYKEQLDYIEWLVTPRDIKLAQGEPTTDLDYSAKYHVARKTLVNWRQTLEFRRAWDQRLQQLNVAPDRIQDMIEAVYERGIKGRTADSKLYLDYVKQFQAPPEVPPPPVDPSELSDDDLQELIAAEAEEEYARRAGA